jgi:hypothetical protein
MDAQREQITVDLIKMHENAKHQDEKLLEILQSIRDLNQAFVVKCTQG